MRTNNRLLNNFLQSIISGELSQNTADGYESDLIAMIKYISKEYHNDSIAVDEADKTFFNTITLEQLNEYKYKLFTDGKSPNTRSRASSSIKQFFEYLNDNGYITSNPAEKLKKVKIPKREPIYMSETEAKKLLKTPTGKNKKRDYAILTIFLNCCLRLSELISIDINKIDFENLTITVIGKGNKEREVDMTPSCITAITEYLKVKPKVEGENALFISERKQRIAKRTVQDLIKKYIGIAGLDEKNYHTHTLRHTGATLIYKNSKDLAGLQEILGHEDVSTTKIYTHIDKEHRKSVANSNPLSNII
jgi:integrase/recombinase XerD